MLIRILKDYSPSEGWRPGEVVEATFDPTQLIIEGKVELVGEGGKKVDQKQTEQESADQEAVAVPGTVAEGE